MRTSKSRPHIYRPQRSCGQGNIFTPVCHSVHRGGLPQCMLGYQHPPDQTHTPHPPPGSRPPQDQTTPGIRHPPPEQTPCPPQGSRLQHTVYERPVRILLECILVQLFIKQQARFHIPMFKWYSNFGFIKCELSSFSGYAFLFFLLTWFLAFLT